MHTDVFTDSLAEYFINDSASVKNGRYCHSRKRLHDSCIRKIRECEEKGYVGWKSCVESKIKKPATFEFQAILTKFLSFLKEEMKSKNTIDSYRNISSKFLVFIEKQGIKCLSTVPLKCIPEYFRELRGTWDPGSLRTAASGIRSFLGFAKHGNRLLAALPKNLLRKRTIIPILTPQEEQSVWDVLKTDAVCFRDKAIMVLSLLTGLRAVDILNLKLGDIDWKCDIISITQRKTGKALALPLLPSIGNALAKYIIKDRPPSNSPHIFLSINAPFWPLKEHTSCYAVIKKIFYRAGIRAGNEIKGTRLLRHHIASKMLRSGVGIQSIALVLGHADPNSSDIYLTTDENKLRDCALSLFKIPMNVRSLQ